VIPDRIAEIGHLIRTQDNRCTAEPLFIVQEQKRTYGFDPAYSDKTVWIGSDGDEVDAEEQTRLEKLRDDGEDIPGDWTRTAYQDTWHFVTACFTEKGCNDYIALNGHNHSGKLRVYADGSWRNEEFRAVRAFLMGLGGETK